MLSVAVVFLAVVLALAACTEPMPEPGTDGPVVVFAPGDQDPACIGWKCTGNSPTMGPWGEFSGFFVNTLPHKPGLPNEAGLRIDGLWKAGVRYEPRVIGARLYGYSGGVLALVGVGLENAHFKIRTTDPAISYELKIKEVRNTVLYWRAPFTSNETYELVYNGLGLKDKPLCENPPSSASGDGDLWTAPLEALLFTGDRYSVDKRIIGWTYSQTTDWFTIGCAGSAPAKMHLRRLTTAGSFGNPMAPLPGDSQSTRVQRQDVLSMYTGNVCGTGRAFTIPGTPIEWEMSNGWRTLPGAIGGYESVWGAGRAQCLDTWRLEDTHPDILDQIEDECALPPPCTGVGGVGWWAAWAGHGTVRSAIP